MMKKWKRMTAAIVMTVAVAIPALDHVALANGEKQADNTVESSARKMAEVLIDQYGATGVQYALRDEGRIVLSGGLGVTNTGDKVPVQKDVMFGIGSISKMYVTAAAMMLADAGKIDIEKPLTDYISEFQMADERYKQITPRMLMNHSAGLYGSNYKNGMLLGDNDMQNHDTLLENLRSERLKSDPGEYSVYANDGFQLLELLVERVSGMSYIEFLNRNINKPLGLISTMTPLDTFNRDRLHPAYFPGIEDALPPESVNVIGTGGIYSTAEELTLFSEVLTGKKPDLLSTKSALAMQNPEYRKGVWVEDKENIFGYGLGWDSVDLAPFGEYGIQALTKGGDAVAYHSALIALPEEHLSIAVLTSGGSSVMNTAAATNILLEYMKDSGVIKNILPDKTFTAPVKANMPASLKAYSGLYGNVGSTHRIKLEQGEFDLPLLMGGLIPSQRYVYTGDHQFTSKDGRTVVSFDEQDNGLTYLRVRSYMDLPGLGQSVVAYYEYQKLDDHSLKGEVKKVWKERNGKTYLALDEKITSALYLMPVTLTKTIELDDTGVYANGTKIKDRDHAVNIAEIPVMSGRDAFDLNFIKKDGIEYLQSGGWIYIKEEDVKPIHVGKGGVSKITIPSTGHVQWFKVGKQAAGRNMTVDLPKNDGFAVYDEDGGLVHFSVVSGNRAVTLPKNGFIVFGGKAGDVIKVAIK